MVLYLRLVLILNFIMDAQNFLYWALGGGVILLVIFICVAIFYLIRILRDVSDATASIKDTAEVVNENVSELASKVTSTADQILTYFVKPFTMIGFLADKVKPFLDMMNKHGKKAKVEEEEYEEEEDYEEEEKPKKKKTKKRGKKKTKKGKK